MHNLLHWKVKFVLAVLAVFASLMQAALEVDAAEIKSVQRGSVVLTSGANRMAVALSPAVDPSKTFIWGGVPHGGGRLNLPAPNATRIGFDLESGTTLALERLGAPANSPTVEWQAVEFSSGAFVQRGAQSLTTTDTVLNVTLPSAVDTTKAFVLVSVAPNSATLTLDEQWTIRPRLTSATNLELSRNEAGIAVDVYWQVVELDGAAVQRGLTTIGAAASSATATITTIDPAKSFLVMSYRGAPASAGAETQYTTRGAITNSTTLTFNRVSTTNLVDIAWEVVSLGDSQAAVQSGATTTAATSNTTLSQPLSAVDLWRSFVYISAQGGSAAANTQLDEVAWTAALTSSTNLQLQRGGTGSHGTVNWQVIQFAGPAPTKLGVVSVNSGSNPLAGQPFSVVVESQDANGNGSVVSADTAVALSLATGTGNLAGANRHDYRRQPPGDY